MKKKSKSILAIVLAILLVIVVAISLTTNILFSRKDTPKIFGHYIYLMEYDTMEAAAGAAVATGTSGQAAGSVDDTSAAASIHQHTAVIASAYKETDPIAKNNAVLCVLAPDDASKDIDSDRVAVRRIYNIEQDETGVLKYYPTTMKASDVGTEPPVTVDSILGKCSYESGELYTYVKFATGVPGILILMVLPSIILVIMLIVTIVRASMGHDDEYTFEENYDEVYSEDSYDDGDSAYDDEELGGRSPLYRPSEATQSRSFEKKRSSIAENFERKQVNPNSPYQKARTMQFKAQHDVPIYTNPADFGTSYQEAKRLIPKKDMLPNPKHKKVLSATAMGIYQYLFNNDNHDEILNYCNERLGKLEEYDHANGTFLLDTLLAYYMNGFSVGKTAQELFIHRNSLQYRLNKIQELVDFELDDYMEYLDVVNCILIKRLMFS